MSNKDQILLENLYASIYLKESESENEELTKDAEADYPENEDDNSEETSEELTPEEEKARVAELVKKINTSKDSTDESDEDNLPMEGLIKHGIQTINEKKKQKWKKGSEYAICTSTVGRKDEAKYKSCKKDVLASHKKSVAKKKKK